MISQITIELNTKQVLYLYLLFDNPVTTTSVSSLT